MRVTRIGAERCRGGECPLWDEADQALYLIDNVGQKVHRYDPATEVTRSWTMPSIITALTLRERGGAVVTLKTGIHFLDFETGSLESVHPLPQPPPIIYNDGKVDRRGRFVIGACSSNIHSPGPDGGVCSMAPDHTLRWIDTGINRSNSPCWSPDDKTFYFSDSFLYTMYAYDYDIDTGEIANKRVFANPAELGGSPDGATVDKDGLVWVAIYRGGKVVAYRPDGSVERIVELPTRLTSSVTFGGPKLDHLYVTSIERDPLGNADPSGGYVYVVEDLGTQGLVEPRYAG
jgi:L-arabinonolactonase